MVKKLLVFIYLIFGFPFFINASVLLAPSASSAFVVEFSTKEVIYESNAHERKNPASMTKIMTMLLVMESIETGVIAWDDIVTVSANASSMGGSQILLETGEKMSVSDMFKGLAVASGNDAAVALAEKIAGTEEMFVEMMNKKVLELGLENTNFKNSHGLDETNHYSSAYDMAMISLELLKYEKVLEFTSIYEDYLRKDTDRAFWLVNTNKLVRFYDGVDGLKTGYTATAGFCMTATAMRDNMRIVAVVMGEPDSTTRNNELAAIFDYVFAQYDLRYIVNSSDILDVASVNKGSLEEVSIVATSDVTDLYLKNDGLSEITYEVFVSDIKAPVMVGDVVGELIIYEDLEEIKRINVTVFEDVYKASLFELYVRYLEKVLR